MLILITLNETRRCAVVVALAPKLFSNLLFIVPADASEEPLKTFRSIDSSDADVVEILI